MANKMKNGRKVVNEAWKSGFHNGSWWHQGIGVDKSKFKSLVSDADFKKAETAEKKWQEEKTKNGERKKKMSEGVAFLIEDVMAKSEVVLAVQAITDKLQDIAEDLSTVEAKEIMPILDSITSAFGPQVSDQFNNVATEQVRNLIGAVQQAKSAIDKEVLRMKKGVEGGDMSDMSMDMDSEEPAPMGDEGGEQVTPPSPAPAANGGLPEITPDQAGNDEDDALGGAFDGGFAGRAKKESAKARGKKLNERGEVAEDFLGGNTAIVGRTAPTPAIDQHPHKSVDFDSNLHKLAQWHGGAGRLARNIESMIDSETLNGGDRMALTNVLSHFAGFVEHAHLWTDAENHLNKSLKDANIWDTNKSPAVQKIVSKLRSLAHLISNRHEGLTESAIKALKESTNPDAMVLKTFRTKLAESRDAQLAAISTARLYAIDIEDVVQIVREFKMNTPKSAEGMFNGDNIADLEKRRTRDKKGDRTAAKTKDLKRVNFAIRAKKSAGDKGWHKKVNEDGQQMIQNATMFPIGDGSAPNPGSGVINPAGTTRPQSTAPVGGPDQNPSTRRPMSPSDRRMMQSQQTAQNTKTGVQAPSSAAQFGKNSPAMVPSGETEQTGQKPPQGQAQQMAQVRQVQKKAGQGVAMPAGQQLRQPK